MQYTSLLNYFPRYSEEEYNQKFRQEVKSKIVQMLTAKINMTDREMAKELGFEDPNKVRPRRHELVKQGIIVDEEHCEKRLCRITGKLSIAWSLDPNKLYHYMEA